MMDQTWDEREAGDHSLAQLAYALRKLAQSDGLSLKGRVFSSLKLTERSLFGDEQEVVYINPVGLDLHQATQADLTGLRQADLVKLAGSDGLSPAQVQNALALSRLDAGAPFPPGEALFHAILPAVCIMTVRLDAVLAVSLTGDSPKRIRQLFGDSLVVLSQGESGVSLAVACRQLFNGRNPSSLRGLLLPDGNLVVMGETPRAAYEVLVDLASQAEAYLQARHAWDLDLPPAALPDRPLRVEIAALRQALSEAAGAPLVLSVDSRPLCLHFTRRFDALARAGRFDALAKADRFDALSKVPQSDLVAGSTPVAGEASQGSLKPWPMLGRDVAAYLAQHGLVQGQAAPRLVLDADLGMAVAGRTATEAAAASELYAQAMTALLRAEKLQDQPLLSIPVQLASLVPPGLLEVPAPNKPLPFTGEVALVTGGASGIGKACVESLLARGAAVVTLDINPRVAGLYERPDFLGLVCDLTDEQAILACFESMARRFGGLDMLVLNAGIFPAGVRIEVLDTAAWQKVMRINLDSNLVILRESQPLLKAAPRYGRVLVNASKNVLAPGAGAAAYSASKAAVTQLARVAALEWGKDKIRVNLVHPDAIFDTGIWTEDVLKARAAHYGMTVQQYKTRNVLGVELNSHYVGELVAEMLGPLFEKITGAQIPVDGGSDRVI
jgi:NAD(P)-dependent dehydrogenase (short-subunit alcohol dehydrogenase family)/rhamnose utilization protein RhaD (predicted bifunctional aldolase and dehydrogenase)